MVADEHGIALRIVPGLFGAGLNLERAEAEHDPQRVVTFDSQAPESVASSQLLPRSAVGRGDVGFHREADPERDVVTATVGLVLRQQQLDVDRRGLPRGDLAQGTGGSASYVPAAGWQPGDYVFRLDLKVEEEFYIESAAQELSVAPVDVGVPGVISFYWWILIGAAIIAIAIFLWLRRRRKAVPEKPVEEAPPPEEEEEAEEAPAEEVAEAPAEEPTKVVEEEPPPLLEEQVEAEDVPEGEIEEPPDAEWEEEAEEVPEGEIEEPPEAEVKEEPSEEEDKPADR